MPNWTYSIWFKLDKLEVGVLAILFGTRYSGGAFSDLPLYVRPSNKHITSYNNHVLDVPIEINLDLWYNLTAVVESSVMSIFINGELIIEGTNYTPSTDDGSDGLFNNYGGNYYISGKYKNDYPAYLNGSIDNVRLYNRALNKYEVLEIYNQEK